MSSWDFTLLLLGVCGALTGVILLICVIFPICGLLKKKRKYRKIKYTTPLEGVVTDADVVQNLSKMEYHYKYALEYYDADINLCHTYLGITTDQVLQIAVGMTLPLRMMQKPLLKTTPEKLESVRSASQLLPAQVCFREWEKAPLDETAMIMLDQDYQRLTNVLKKQIRSSRITFWVLLIIGLVLLGLSLFALWSAVYSVQAQML